jgi:hypothetical protein
LFHDHVSKINLRLSLFVLIINPERFIFINLSSENDSQSLFSKMIQLIFFKKRDSEFLKEL